ncbi:MAG: CBS domain-containing protein [Deltaproteobacteria bacterium]|nr:MAG: CBS domain-containing protein [Deltaproteobacteria bacterium]
MSDVTAADVMTRQVVTLTPTTHIYDAMETLLRHRISGAPVIDGGRLVGVLSEYDCMKVGSASLTDLYAPAGGPVAQFMSTEVLTTHEDAPIGDLIATFLSQRVRRMPVVDEHGTLIGLVSRRDVLRGLLQSQDGRYTQVGYPDYRRPQ